MYRLSRRYFRFLRVFLALVDGASTFSSAIRLVVILRLRFLSTMFFLWSASASAPASAPASALASAPASAPAAASTSAPPAVVFSAASKLWFRILAASCPSATAPFDRRSATSTFLSAAASFGAAGMAISASAIAMMAARISSCDISAIALYWALSCSGRSFHMSPICRTFSTSLNDSPAILDFSNCVCRNTSNAETFRLALVPLSSSLCGTLAVAATGGAFGRAELLPANVDRRADVPGLLDTPAVSTAAAARVPTPTSACSAILAVSARFFVSAWASAGALGGCPFAGACVGICAGICACICVCICGWRGCTCAGCACVTPGARCSTCEDM
mmetsp:Transcript_176/g.559  ORF Transcript_176/g.559 Transcript_176/m.559 type:complete len:333 (-) Transcript_176:600-1598(-)